MNYLEELTNAVDKPHKLPSYMNSITISLSHQKNPALTTIFVITRLLQQREKYNKKAEKDSSIAYKRARIYIAS